MAEVKTDPKPNSETVLVSCKLPHGLNLDIHEDHVGAGVPPLKARVKIPGIMAFRIPNPDRKFINPETYLGHTVTEVPRRHWEEWLAKNKNHPAVTRGFIFVSTNEKDARAEARERQSETTGFEQLDPKRMGVRPLDGDPRPLEIR